jgi:Clp amino terminal domain, pathogenicity island component
MSSRLDSWPLLSSKVDGVTLDEAILTQARTARDRFLELQHESERAQADFRDAVRRLHAAGGSMREIGEGLGLSHQRVHQIVEEFAPSGRPEGRWAPVHRARRAVREAFTRFAADARKVVADAQEEAQGLGHGFVGTEHLLLAVLRGEVPGAGALGKTYEEARARVVEKVGERGRRHRGRGHLRFTPAAKRALELALREARHLKDDHVGAEHIVLGLLHRRGGFAAEYIGDLSAARSAVLRELGRA